MMLAPPQGFGAADDPWIVVDSDIKGEINTLSGLISLTNQDIQNNKSRFSNRDLKAWHEFVTEWLAWKKEWLDSVPHLRATSGTWIKAKTFKSRALEWVEVVQRRLGVKTPGLPAPPEKDRPWWGSAPMWGILGVVGVFGVGYLVRSFGVASIARAKAQKQQARTAAKKPEAKK